MHSRKMWLEFFLTALLLAGLTACGFPAPVSDEDTNEPPTDALQDSADIEKTCPEVQPALATVCKDVVDGLAFAEKGLCLQATLVCDEGAWECVAPEGLEGTEKTCDGKDNDCDGEVDNVKVTWEDVCPGADSESEDQSCACNKMKKGVCNSRKEKVLFTCAGEDGDFEYHCDYAPLMDGLEAPYAEYEYLTTANGDLVTRMCDGFDNDCDGETDEPHGFQHEGGFEGSFTGNELDGVAPEEWGECPEKFAGVCGIDIVPQEGFDVVDITGDWVALRCNSETGAVQCAMPADAPEEADGETICDGLDNDCDGETDEELDVDDVDNSICPHLGVCDQLVTASCFNGEWFCDWSQVIHEPSWQPLEQCEDGAPATCGAERLCDGLDNDCDGEVDEGLQFQPDYGGDCLEDLDEDQVPDCAYELCGVYHPDCDPTNAVVDWLDCPLDSQGNISLMGVCAPDPVTGETAVLTSCEPKPPFGAEWLCNYAAVPLYNEKENNSFPQFCDGLDNNCDGVVDGFWSDEDQKAEYIKVSPTQDDPMGTTCRVHGECNGKVQAHCNKDGLAPGQWSCSYDSTAQLAKDIEKPAGCDNPDAPSCLWTETQCDGKDNDCDGVVDELLDNLKLEMEVCDVYSVNGVCSTQVEQLNTRCAVVDEISGEKAFMCDLTGLGDLYVPEEDGVVNLCDGEDNDCDGLVDESIVAFKPEDLATAGCLYQGVCADGTVATCNLDDAEPGIWTCNYEQVQAHGAGFINVEMQVEVECDGLDNDCDGLVDEDLDKDLGEPAGDDNPKLKSGCPLAGICDGNIKWACDAEDGSPDWICDTSEVFLNLGGGVIIEFEDNETSCDGFDNDCDGLLNEDLNDVGVDGANCKNKGVCQGNGVTAACVEGQYLCYYDEVDAYDGAKEASCDGLDNDCDGFTDEDLDWKEVGACKNEGVCASPDLDAQCLGELGWDCFYELVGSDYEELETTCDSLDNDCDGTTDLAICQPCEPCKDDNNCMTAACKPTPDGELYCSVNPSTCIVVNPESGQCQTVPAGTQACKNSTQPVLCTQAGAWYDNLNSCSGQEPVCYNGQCLACIPGSTQCDGNVIQNCPDGAGWADASVCAPGFICLGEGKCVENNEIKIAGDVTAGAQDVNPVVIVRNGGGPVIAYATDAAAGGQLTDVVARRYSEDLSQEGPAFTLNNYLASNQSEPALSAIPKENGGFVAVWTSDNQDGSGAGVFGAIFSKYGERQVEDDIAINTYVEGSQESPSVAAFFNGDFMVTWESTTLVGDGLDDDGRGVYMRLFKADGTPHWNTEKLVNSYVQSDQRWPSVAARDDEGYVIAWTSTTQDQSNQAAVFVPLNEMGDKIDQEYVANEYTQSSQKRIRTAGFGGLRAGWYAHTWESFGQDGSSNGVYMNIYNSDAEPQWGEDVPVNEGILTGSQKDPSIAILGDNSIAITWETPNMDSDGDAVAARVFDQWGNPLNGEEEFQVNQNEDGDQENPDVAALGSGGYVVVWSDVTNVPFNVDIFMRVFKLSN